MVNLTLPQLPPPGSKWEYGPNGSNLVPLNDDSPSNSDLVVKTVSDEMSISDSLKSMEELFGEGFKTPEYNYEDAFSTIDGALIVTGSDQLTMANQVTTNSMSGREQTINFCNSPESEKLNGMTSAVGNHRTSNSNFDLQEGSGIAVGHSGSPAAREIPTEGEIGKMTYEQAISRKVSYQEPPVNSHYMNVGFSAGNSGYQSTVALPSNVGPSSPYPVNNHTMPFSNSSMVSTPHLSGSNGMISYDGYPSARVMAPTNNGSTVSMSSLDMSNTINYSGYPSAHNMVLVDNNSMAPTILSSTMHNMNFGDYHHSPNVSSSVPDSFGSLSPEELDLLDGVDFVSLEKTDKKVHLQRLSKAYMFPGMANIGHSSAYNQKSPVLASGENTASSPTPSTPTRKTKGRAEPASTPPKRRKTSQSSSGSSKSPASPPNMFNGTPSTPPKRRKISQSSSSSGSSKSPASPSSMSNGGPSTPPKRRNASQSSSGSSKSPVSPSSILNDTPSYTQDMVSSTPRYNADQNGGLAHTDPRFEFFRELGTILGIKTDMAVPATGMWKFKYFPDEIRTKIWQLSVSGGRTFNLTFDKNATWEQIQFKRDNHEGILTHDQKLPGAILANKESYRAAMMLLKTVKPPFMTKSITFNPSMDIILFNSLGVLNSCVDYDINQWSGFGIQKLGIDDTFFKTLADVSAATTKDWLDTDRLNVATNLHYDGGLDNVAIFVSGLRNSLKDVVVFGETMDKACCFAGTLGMVIIDLKKSQDDIFLKIQNDMIIENHWILPRLVPMERSSDGN